MSNGKPTLTEADLAAIRSVVRPENVELAEAIADLLRVFYSPLSKRLETIETVLRIVIEGQSLVEKALLPSEKPPADDDAGDHDADAWNR